MALIEAKERQLGYQRPSTPRQMELSTPLGADALTIHAFKGREALSAPFHFTVNASVREASADISTLPGEGASVTLIAANGEKRYFHGLIDRAISSGDALILELHAWPRFWQLSKDCRIFQDQSVPEIVKALGSEMALGDIDDQLIRTYAKRDYCVQYRETAFDFIARLLAENGILYTATFSDGNHKLCLLDDASSYPDLGEIGYLDIPETAGWGEEAAVHEACFTNAITTTKFVAEDYNFETPSTDLTSEAGQGGFRIYDYPAKVAKKAEAEAVARDRLEMCALGGIQLAGASSVRSLTAGAKFTLKDHPQSVRNACWLVTEVTHDASPGQYRNRFRAIPIEQDFRPLQPVAKPVIAGIQTAKVVGPQEKEIWTDSYGRIRVKFHWDQREVEDETCSCWIRVAQIWAGNGWGGFVLPRIGQEVVVAFLDGDPDRPLVTGCVYNGENAVPYPLADEATKTGLKTNTSPADQAEGKGYNELFFEDKAGSELISITAQKDMSIDIANDRTVVIDKGNDSLTLNEGNREVTLSKGNETVSIKGTRELTVEGNETRNNKADVTHTISGDATFKVDGNVTIKAGGSLTIEAGTSLSLKAGTGLSLEAGTDLSGKAGTALSMEGATMEVKGSGMGTIDGGGMLTVKGGLVKIN